MIRRIASQINRQRHDLPLRITIAHLFILPNVFVLSRFSLVLTAIYRPGTRHANEPRVQWRAKDILASYESLISRE